MSTQFTAPCEFGTPLYQLVPSQVTEFPNKIIIEYKITKCICSGFEFRPLQSFILDEGFNRINIKQFNDTVFFTEEAALERNEEIKREQLRLLNIGDTVFEIDTYTNDSKPCVVECVISNIFHELTYENNTLFINSLDLLSKPIVSIVDYVNMTSNSIKEMINEEDDIYFEIQGKEESVHDNVISLSQAPFYLFFSERIAENYSKYFELAKNTYLHPSIKHF